MLVCIDCMRRSSKQSAVLSTWGSTLPATCPGAHTDRITNSANKTLGFMRNVRTKMSGVREAAFNTLARPQLEYAAAIWDPHTRVKTEQIEKVQRRAALWTTCYFDRMSSISALLETLSWRTLEQRRADSRLCLFYKIVNNMVAVPLPDYIKPNPRTSRRGHSMTFKQIHTGKDFYKYSIFPLAVVQWNALPESAVSSPSMTYSRLKLASCSTSSLKIPSIDCF